MRVVIGALSLVLLLAGCLGPASTMEKPEGDTATLARPVRPVVDRIAFAATQVLGRMTGGAEPSIAVAPDGTVYVTTPLALWRSDDGGKTYKPIGNRACPQNLPQCPGLETYRPGMRGGGDADIYVSADGRVHWLGLADGNNAIPYQYSDDKGETWSAVVDLAGEDSADREWITGEGDNSTIYAAWRNFPAANSGRKAMIVMRTSHDGGLTWEPSVDIAPDTRQGGISVDPSSGALALAHDVAGKVSMAHSFDGGATWQSVLVAQDPVMGHIFPVSAFDSNGTLYLAYAHDRDGVAGQGTLVPNRPLEQPVLYLQTSHDKGLTWSKPVQVNAAGTTAWFPWIAAGADGRVVLVWYQNDRGLPRQVADEVYVMSGISVDADAATPHFKNVRAAKDPVHRGPECRENPGACTRSLLDFFEVAIHPAGYPVLTWAQDIYQVPGVTVAASHMSEGPDLLH
jgi:hypothetical protein